MEQHHSITPTLVAVILSLALGAGAGFFYGRSQGKNAGRIELLAEQEKEAEQAIEQAQAEVIERANPFAQSGAVNPFEGQYENPFEGASANPFAN